MDHNALKVSVICNTEKRFENFYKKKTIRHVKRVILKGF